MTQFDLVTDEEKWVGAFQALSVPQFDLVKTVLGYKVAVPQALRRVARDFSVAYLGDLCGESTSFKPKHNLLAPTLESSKSENLYRRLLLATFEQLKEIDRHEEVYQWGQQLYDARMQPQSQLSHKKVKTGTSG